MTHDNHNACCTNQNILLPSFVGHKKRKTQQQRKKKKPILSGTHITSNHDHILSRTTFPPILTPS